jgi:hypothetical protein
MLAWLVPSHWVLQEILERRTIIIAYYSIIINKHPFLVLGWFLVYEQGILERKSFLVVVEYGISIWSILLCSCFAHLFQCQFSWFRWWWVLFYSFKVVLLLLLLLLSLEWIDRTQQYSKFEALSTSCDFYDCLCYKAEYSMCFFLCFWWRVLLDKTL